MSNLTAFFIIAVICLVSGRRYDLCRVIFFYYIGYFVLHPVSYLSVPMYYAAQLALDAYIIVWCCKISYLYKHHFVIPLAYAVIIFSSLVCDGLKLIDEAAGYYVFTELHQLRQSYSIQLDIAFALVGSNGLRFILYSIIRPICANIARNRANNKA